MDCETELKKVKDLLEQAYSHLEYCNWGDAWEKECSEKLRKELNEYFLKEGVK